LLDESGTREREGESMNTMQDLIDLIKPILPNALIIDTDEGVLIETGLELDLGGLLQTIEREGE
jgi:hypothetical protein